ncbi:MAG: LuxR C-terminal-related transcriptional regulator [Silvibacterium sp.]
MPGRNFVPPPVTRALASRMPDGELSTREREVLALLVRGRATGKSADELSIKEATVKSHVSVILMRLDLADRTQAVAVKLYLDGKIRQWYSRGDVRGVVFFLDVKTVDEAHAVMETLPLAKENLMDQEYIPVGPLMPLAGLINGGPAQH